MSKEKRMVLFIEGSGSPMIAYRIGRNEKCRCGSGKKQKKCCGVETKYYDSKKNGVNA